MLRSLTVLVFASLTSVVACASTVAADSEPDVAPLAGDQEGAIYRLDDAPSRDASSIECLAVGPDAVYAAGEGATLRAIPKEGGRSRVIASLPDAGAAASEVLGLVYAQGMLYWLVSTSGHGEGPNRVRLAATDTNARFATRFLSLPAPLDSLLVNGPPLMVARGRGVCFAAPLPDSGSRAAIACIDPDGNAVAATAEAGAQAVAARGDTLFVLASGGSAAFAFDGDLKNPPRKVAEVEGKAIAIGAGSDGLDLLMEAPPPPPPVYVTYPQGDVLVHVDASGAATRTSLKAPYDHIDAVAGVTVLLRQTAAYEISSTPRESSYGGRADFARSEGKREAVRFAVPETWLGTSIATDGTWAYVGVWTGGCAERGECFKWSCECRRYSRSERIERFRL
jgi:hypothetical protein